jgi:HSP20 family molecular chaperone IbpA
MKLALLLFFIFNLSSFAQRREHSDAELARIRKHMQMREELHRKMLDNLMSGKHDENLFQDMEKLFDDAMKDSLGGSSFQFSSGDVVETEWQESSAGRTLFITPQSKDQKLDINVQNEMVTIKGKTANSEFQNSFSIPQDCDSGKVKMDQKNGKIVMFFPWRVAKKISPKKDERVPLPKTDSDVTI